MATTVRRTVLTLPAAPLGPANPLPALRPLTRLHTVDERVRAELPRDMARQMECPPPRTVLPVRLLDGYGRDRAPADLDALVIENDLLRVTVLPSLGGRVHSLYHRPTGRELLYRNPVLQPAAFALNGAWFSGGIEWNIGSTGHSTLTAAPLHAAVVPAPDGGEMVRLWEWERLRDLPFQIDLWLPEDSAFLHVGIRIRNPHERAVPVYWWSNTAVEEHPATRVLAPADEAWHFGYDRALKRVPVPDYRGEDRTYPQRGEHPADYFYEIDAGTRKWIAALDGSGRGLVQTSTDALRGRKLFLWGSGRGGRRWQRWLTEPGTTGYAEIQAGLARTQFEHLRLAEGAELGWLECYGPLAADSGTVHGNTWAAACAEVESALAAVLPRRAVEEAHRAWLATADTAPVRTLATGSGWGALEQLRSGTELPGTPFDMSTLGEEQRPWRDLLTTGALPAPGAVSPPGPSLVAPYWRDMLETAPADPLTEYHLGVAQWHAGDRAQAVRSWERGLALASSRWPLLRCLAVADEEDGHPRRAADRHLAAFDDLCRERREDGAWPAATAALGREAIEALLHAGRAADARSVWLRLGAGIQRRGRFALLHARLLLAEGHPERARAVFEEGFEVPDLREGGARELVEVWSALTDDPLPEAYDYRTQETPAGGTPR
ncbi:DUF5107 domain-containing protein [Streptomyces sp. NPDC000594]|uniref:DUF5107 domain-containing protein n=1 Tax=Streptomyces sp. NPDC000594 TaxID=3154261 RepID=UPI003318D668